MDNNYNSKEIYVNSSNNYQSSSVAKSSFEYININTILIVILVILLVFSLIGINILGIFGQFIVNVIANIKPLIINLLKSLGLITGTIIDTSGDVVYEIGDTVKNVTDTVGGGLVAISKGENNIANDNGPKPMMTDTTINAEKKQKGGGFCLVGNYSGKNGCIEIDEYDKCLSGKVFPTKSQCLSAGEKS